MTSTLDGYVPLVGDLVVQQMYSPTQPEWCSTIQERIANGVTYGSPRTMRVAGVTAAQAGSEVSRWHLVDPERPNSESRMSWVESDWCVLTPVLLDGQLF